VSFWFTIKFWFCHTLTLYIFRPIDVLYRIKNEMMSKSDRSRKLLPDTLEQLLEIESKGLHSFDLITREFNQIRSGGEFWRHALFTDTLTTPNELLNYIPSARHVP
jgi:hypothetical protein